jgi:4-hydroxy-3-methylbut-2-en-1-yl diphosphate synthase IspG/GcpE
MTAQNYHVDYTMFTERKIGKGEIAQCPQCGRNGITVPTEAFEWQEYIHKETGTLIAGVVIWDKGDRCFIPPSMKGDRP